MSAVASHSPALLVPTLAIGLGCDRGTPLATVQQCLQQALALGVIGFVVGKITATFAAPLFPKYVLLMPLDSVVGFFAVLAICVLASLVAIRMALKVDPAEAIGG